MDEFESLSHSKGECKYHGVFIPKCRRRTLYEQLRRHLGEVFRRRAEQKESRIEAGHLMPDQVHMLISIPPKYAVSQVVGSLKGKSAIPRAGIRRAQAPLCRAALLGTGLLCLDRRPRGGADSRVHPSPRAGGPAMGPTQSGALTGHLRVAQDAGAALAAPFSRFEQLTT
jgi:putative transposase